MRNIDIGVFMSRFFTILIIMVLQGGCAATRQYTNETYRYETGKVHIVVFPFKKDLIEIADRADVIKIAESDPREPKSVIIDSSYKYLIQGIKDTIEYASLVSIRDSLWGHIWEDTSNFFPFEMKIGRDSIVHAFTIPKKSFVQSIDTNINVLFLINHIGFSRENTDIGGGGSIEYLGATVEYLVWDYDGNQVISCGDFSTGAAIFFKITDKTWKNLFKSIGSNFAYETPFLRNTFW